MPNSKSLPSSKLTWAQLNRTLLGIKTDWEAAQLLEAEKRGPRRMRWLLRIYARYAVLRRKRELKELRNA